MGCGDRPAIDFIMVHQSTVASQVPGWLLVGLMLVLTVCVTGAQRGRSVPLSDSSIVLDTDEHRIRVVVTKGLSRPWGLAFLPDGTMLVTERGGHLRRVRDGVVDPRPIMGVPMVHAVFQSGLMDVALHPEFIENRLVYLTYSKADERGQTIALARGRFEGHALRDVRDIFVAEPWKDDAKTSEMGAEFPTGASRIAFLPDGTLLMTVGGAFLEFRSRGQDPSDHAGKLLRLRDDGSVPDDNPFVGRAGYRPEIYSLGHRNQLGLAVDHASGVIWENEQGPQGGDEVNHILPGRNYGWPTITYGRDYSGRRIAPEPSRPGMEQPFLFWVPSIGVSGLTLYSGNRFPAWKGNVFVGALFSAAPGRPGQVQRLIFNESGMPTGRESLLTELGQRIRDVRQGPDGLLYVLTDEDAGALLRIEPA